MCRIILVVSPTLNFPPSVDIVDGSGSLPRDAAGGGAVSSALFCAPRCLHHHRGSDLRPARADGHPEKYCERHACGHGHTVSTSVLMVTNML